MGIFTPILLPEEASLALPLHNSQVEISACLHCCLPWYQLCEEEAVPQPMCCGAVALL